MLDGDVKGNGNGDGETFIYQGIHFAFDYISLSCILSDWSGRVEENVVNRVREFIASEHENKQTLKSREKPETDCLSPREKFPTARFALS
jgi:hypothetical protein